MSATFYSNRSSMRKKKPLGTSDNSPTELVSRNMMQGTKTDFKSIFYLKPDPKEDEGDALEDNGNERWGGNNGTQVSREQARGPRMNAGREGSR